MTKHTMAVAACVWLALAGSPALAADAAKEIATASVHAGMAAGSQTLPMTQAHLHHVLNCLEGPSGADFDVKALDPCTGQGAGAIPDSPPDKRKALEAIALEARQALGETDLGKAKAAAAAVEAKLKM